jgi:hypothetical protein
MDLWCRSLSRCDRGQQLRRRRRLDANGYCRQFPDERCRFADHRYHSVCSDEHIRADNCDHHERCDVSVRRRRATGPDRECYGANSTRGILLDYVRRARRYDKRRAGLSTPERERERARVVVVGHWDTDEAGDRNGHGDVWSAPLQGIGRPLKVSKEEIVGLLTALEIWVNRDHAADLREAKRRTDHVVQALTELPGMAVEHRFPDHVGRPYPTVFVSIDPTNGLTGAKVIDLMLAGDPSIAIMNFTDPQIVRVDVRVLSNDETRVVAARLRDVLERRSTGTRVNV